ncbi:hypothetical protein DFQ28_003045 [Apophysomyces sp. BC1034]|nr:hypothetical protein DFQ28_003045 [Apophysomyces sp. BC1034]
MDDIKHTYDLTHPHWNLDSVVAELRASRESKHRTRHPKGLRELPSRTAMAQMLSNLRAVLFPTHFGTSDLTDESIDFFVGNTLNGTLRVLYEQLRRALRFAPGNEALPERELRALAEAIARDFAASLPATRALLVSDIHAAYTGDPAAQNTSEVMLSYPGIEAIINHRLAHTLYRAGVPLLPRFIAEIGHSATGIDIHPGARIGSSFFIDHGTGVVIGETAIIGERVRLYQAVTLGARRFEDGEDGTLVKGNARHPVVEDDVVIYAGATILGRITIGRGSVIGGNVWLTRSVPPGSAISQGNVRHGDADVSGAGDKLEV